MALGCDAISGAAIIYRHQNGKTLLHTVAGAIGQLATSGDRYLLTEECERHMLGWKSIVQELVVGGTYLHATFSAFHLGNGCDTRWPKKYTRVTPISSMFAGSFPEWWRWHCPEMDPGKAMSIYITTLHDFGVDLKEYGLREKLTWESLERRKSYIGDQRDSISDYYFGRKRLVGFNYRPYPGDWRV
jgi:hypothetical protein